MSKVETVRLLILFSLLLPSQSPAFADTNQAAAALNQGRADDATRILKIQLASNPHDGTAHQLLCRVFYSQELAEPAIHECEAAVADAALSEGSDESASDNYLWLGRAYGLKASRANPISAFRLAKKVAASFQRAVELDPANVAALSDLGEFYAAAPSVVGGGLDKAQQLSTRIMAVSPSKAHRLLGMIAEKQGDTTTAEAEFKKAVDAQRSPETYVDLGDFYQRHHQYDQSFAAVLMAIRLDHARDAAMVDAASILTESHRDLKLARQLLEEYLASPAKQDDAPAAKVHKQLGDLLATTGDPAGARREYESALALASNYAPAHKALQALPPLPGQTALRNP
jgi:tetratricopeptide (TPR) repeat protein